MAATFRENAAIVWRFLSDVVAGGDTGAIPDFLTEDVADHNLVFGNSRGREGVIALGWQVLTATEVDIADMVATQERVVVCATVAGMHRESLIDLTPPGASFQITYAWVCRIDEGQIAEIWSLPNGLMQQLDVIPEEPTNCSLSTPTDINYDIHHSESTWRSVKRPTYRDRRQRSGGG